MPHRNPFAWLVLIGICCSIAAMSRALVSPPAAEASTPAPRASARIQVATGAAATPQAVVTQVPPAKPASGATRPSATPTETASPSSSEVAGATSVPQLLDAQVDPVGTLPAASSTPAHAVLVSNGAKAGALLDEMNSARIAAGLVALEPNAALADVALTRARNLVSNGYFDHYAPDGESAFTELAARGIGYRLAGENLARNNYSDSRTAQASFDALIASPGHRANILGERFASVGVAAVLSDHMWVYVTVFKD